MALSKTMEEALAKGDLRNVYSSFYTILLSDPGFFTGKFDAAFAEVQKRNVPQFLQEYNGVPFKSEEEWNQEYWDSLASELMDNFCIERIDYIKKVGKKLYTDKEHLHVEAAQKKRDPIDLLTYQQKVDYKKRIIIIAVVIILLILIIVFLF